MLELFDLTADVQKIDLNGKVIMPGLVDTHSHIGEACRSADSSSPIHPEVRVLDWMNARAASIQRAQSGGITTANVMPGSGHLNSGQTLYIKLRDGNIIDDILIKYDDGRICRRNEVCQWHKFDSSGWRKFPGDSCKIGFADARTTY